MPINSSQGAQGNALHLIFEYEGDQIRLVSQQVVDKAITDLNIERSDIPGHFIETRDINGQPLARVSAQHAFASSAEVFPENNGEPIIRIAKDQIKGAFSVVIRTPIETTQISVIRVAPVFGLLAQDGAMSVTELATFPLQINPTQGDTQ